MTIFNVIKYPISSPPTLEELQNLPEDVYKKWVTKVLFTKGNYDSKLHPVKTIHKFITSVHPADVEFWESHITDLRMMISRLRRDNTNNS